MDLSPDSAKTQKHYKHSQWLKTILHTVWASPKYCSLCLENKGDFYPLDKHLSIYEKSASKSLRDVIDCIFNFHIEDLIPNGFICIHCTEKVIHCYTFIENTKKLHKVIENCVNDLHSKATDINNELNQKTDYSEANVMIVVECDSETDNHIDDLLSAQSAILSDSAKLLNKIETEKSPEKKPNSAENVRVVKKPDEKVEARMTVKIGSKDMVIAPTPRVIKHPRLEKEIDQAKDKCDPVNKDSAKTDSEKESTKTQSENDIEKVTHTTESNPKPSDVKPLENQINTFINEDKFLNKKGKRRKSVGKSSPNVTLKNGKLIIQPLVTNTSSSTPNLNTYSCSECLETFSSYRFLKEHEKIKHNSIIYKCRICYRPYNTQQYLDVHYKAVHSKARCKFCFGLYDCDLNNPDNLNNHLIDEHKNLVFICKHCDLVFCTPDQLETHVKSMHNSTDLTYTSSRTQCIMCLRNFIDEELRTHKCKFACLDCPVFQKPCIHFNYLTSFREQVLTNASTIKCIDCDYTTKRKEHLICHVNREHLEYHPFTCDDCGTEFYTKLSLKTHIVTFHQNLKCEFCDLDLKSQKLLASHRAICRSITRQFICEKCVASFDTEEELQRHIETGHSEIVYPCTLCNKEFHNEVVLGEHHARHHSGIQYRKRRRFIECTLCNINFKNLREMTEHEEKTHNSGEEFPCNVCAKSYPSLKQVYQHKQQHYSVRIRCDGCYKSVSDKLIDQHLLMCPYFNGEKKAIVCEECGKSFRKESDLRTHKKVHLEPEQCRYCERILKPSSLRNHMKNIHPNIDPNATNESEIELNNVKINYTYRCTVCEFTTKTKVHLENHVNRKHLKIKPYICPICKKSFCGKFRLHHHMKSHNDRVCTCTECGKQLANKTCLKMHMMRHTGEFPYECNICFEKFRTSSIMKTHRMKKHQDKTINCPLCGTMFHMAPEMRFHVKKIHWKRPGPFDYKAIVPEEYHYLFEDRRLQKLGSDSDDTVGPLMPLMY